MDGGAACDSNKANHMSVTHVSGIVVFIQRRAIQRCAICGEKLIDQKNLIVGSMPEFAERDYIAINRMCNGPEPEFWDVGSLVRCDGENQFPVELRPGRLPDDNCCDLVE